MPASAASLDGRFARTAVPALTVIVFATVVAIVTLQLRAGLRDQMLRREAEKFAAVASMQLDNAVDALGDTPVAQAPAILFNAVLKTSKLSGVVGVRVFDAQGQKNGA